MKPMTAAEQGEHEQTCLAVRSALSALRLTCNQDDELRSALMHLEEWLEENDGRWVK